MHNILQRKYKETGGKLRHTLGYYAQMIANQTGNKLNWRELKAEYLNMFGNAMFENFADGKKPRRKGLSKRVGIPKGATLAQLEKIARIQQVSVGVWLQMATKHASVAKTNPNEQK